jgi:DNA-binding MarR family transcriptional regulator
MSTELDSTDGMTTEQAVRAMLLLMPRVVGRAKRTPLPERLRSTNLAPRHLSLLSYLLFDGEMTVSDLAGRLEVAVTTVSLMVGDLSRQGVVERSSDPRDRRRTLVRITQDEQTRAAIEGWLANGARAWEKAFEPLAATDRAMFVRTLRAYEGEAGGPDEADPADEAGGPDEAGG